MTSIAVVDHGAGNLVSIVQGLARAGADPRVTTDPDALDGCDGVVLPGVGATATVMAGLRRTGFDRALRNWDGPLLGICVGMQVLFEQSDEDGAPCLGLLDGDIRRLQHAPRLPHIGWNDLTVRRHDSLLAGLPDSPTVYFVHSYAPNPTDSEDVVAETSYGGSVVAVVSRGPITGTQFHPERSGTNGLRILANFVSTCSTTEDVG